MKLFRVPCVFVQKLFSCKNQIHENEMRSFLLARQEHSHGSCVPLTASQGCNGLFLNSLVYTACCGFKGLVRLWGCSSMCVVCLKSVQWIKIFWRSVYPEKIPFFGQWEKSISCTNFIKLWVPVYFTFGPFLSTSRKIPKTFYSQVLLAVSGQFLCTSSFYSLRLSHGCSAQIWHYYLFQLAKKAECHTKRWWIHESHFFCPDPFSTHTHTKVILIFLMPLWLPAKIQNFSLCPDHDIMLFTWVF